MCHAKFRNFEGCWAGIFYASVSHIGRVIITRLKSVCKPNKKIALPIIKNRNQKLVSFWRIASKLHIKGCPGRTSDVPWGDPIPAAGVGGTIPVNMGVRWA
jgi:hypothetical protein